MMDDCVGERSGLTSNYEDEKGVDGHESHGKPFHFSIDVGSELGNQSYG